MHDNNCGVMRIAYSIRREYALGSIRQFDILFF